jgi:hypothetical protein
MNVDLNEMMVSTIENLKSCGVINICNLHLNCKARKGTIQNIRKACGSTPKIGARMVLTPYDQCLENDKNRDSKNLGVRILSGQTQIYMPDMNEGFDRIETILPYY